MEGIYKEMIGIFDDALETIHDGLYESGAALFNNMFFNLAFMLTVCYLGYLLMFQKMKSDELAYKMIWLIIVFTLVKGILAKQWLYIFFLEIINAPANALLEMITHIVTGANQNANLENIVETLIFALRNVHDTIYEKGSWDNWLPYMYALFLNLCGTLVIVAIILFSVFSIFLAKTVLALSPFIIIFLLWKKTEYIFFNWLRLYVSLSLYPAMTVLFGLVCYQVAKYMQKIATSLPEGGFEGVIGICAALVLVALAIFKIPNIINQVIGSANEGSSLSSGLATMSAGAALIGGVAKWSGAKLGGEAAGKGIGALGGLGVDALKKKWFNSK